MTHNKELTAYIQMLIAAKVTDPRVLQAMQAIPRGLFIADKFQPYRFDDTALPIECGQTLSQPSVVGIMTQALAVSPRHKVLEIGAGSGFQTAILSQLARRVYSLDRHHNLVQGAQARLAALEIVNTTVLLGDGGLGLPAQAPFDRIILTAAAEDAPAPLLAQLKTDGIMVLPVGQSQAMQNLIKITKTAKRLVYEDLTEVRFVPLVEGIATAGEAMDDSPPDLVGV